MMFPGGWSALFFLAAVALRPAAGAFAYHEGCVGPDEVTGYAFTPNCSGVNRDPAGKEWPFRTNELGLVAEEDHSLFPSEGVLRVLVVGPSLTVNLSPEIGIVPSLEQELRRAKPRLGRRFRKLELINGSAAGNTIVQSHLRLPALLQRYHPHLVIFFSSFVGLALQTANDHFSSRSFDSSGLAREMGKTASFWPFSADWNPWFWKNLGPEAVRHSVRARGLRLAFYKLLIRSGLGRYRSPDRFSLFANLHLRYLQAMRDASERAGARFLVVETDGRAVNVEAEFAESLKRDSWYKPEWIAGRLLPFPHLSNTELHQFQSALSALYQPVPMPMLRMGAGESYPGDYHPNDKGMMRLGAALAPEVLSRLETDFGSRR